jgi:hypothetical protein
MNMANKTFLAWILSIIAVSAFAAPCSNSASYFYINGVSIFADTHRFIAADSIKRLLLSRGIITTEVVTPLRNPSEGAYIDTLIELVNQKLAEKSAANFADAVQKATMMSTGNPAYAMSASDKALLIVQQTAFFDRTKNLPATSAVTAGMVSAVNASLSSGNKAIVIAHSQGNMFANSVLNSITAAQPAITVAGLKVVSIATPAASSQDSRYKTANQDSVITQAANWLALSLGAPMPLVANIDVPGALNYDLSGHGLLEVYLNPALSAVDNVVAMVTNAVATAYVNCYKPISPSCPDTFTQTQLSQIQPGMTLLDINQVLGCPGNNQGVSSWYMWYNNQSLASTTLNTVSVLLTNGVYQAGSSKSISGIVIP